MRTVLIVDDEKKIRQKYKKLLKIKGFQVVEAASAIETTDMLMRKGSTIDLILLDINIPEVDGRGVFELVEEYASDLPIIITSVHPVNDQKLRIPRAADYYSKLQKENILLRKIRSVLGIVDEKTKKS